LVFLQYFNANRDGWDPAVINGFAVERAVIQPNLAGIASTGGQTPDLVAALMRDFIALCEALRLDTIDLVGFSLGGAIAQQTALDQRQQIRADLGRHALLRCGSESGSAALSRLLQGCSLASQILLSCPSTCAGSYTRFGHGRRLGLLAFGRLSSRNAALR